VAPTNCAQADNSIGCCDGNTLYYCEAGEGFEVNCATSGQVCGWSGSVHTGYDCVSGPATADPSGTYPIACE
jgi:hypothetical protein